MKVIEKLSLLLVASLLALNLQAHDSEHEQQNQAAANADDPHAEHKSMMNKPEKSGEATRVDLLDLTLVDRQGRKMKFASDVIGDRIVVMDFVYTTCTTICPVISAVFGQLQNKLGDRLGDDVVMISLSTDPVRDTPKRLNAYAKKHNAQPGWIWLTGEKRTMDEVLDGLGAYSSNFEEHASMVLVGDRQSGQWSRFFGFPNPDRIIEQINALKAARNQVSGG